MSSEKETSPKERPVHQIHYHVDGEQQTTDQEKLTPVQIMQKAGVDPTTHFLVQIKGNDRISYKDHPNNPIEMHDGMKFVTVASGATPVS